MDNIYEIPLKQIVVSEELNVRHQGAERNIEELANSIRHVGLLQPVVLIGEYGQPPYKLVIGQRRFKAHEYLKAKYNKPNSISAIFLDTKDNTEILIRSLTENMQRVELNHADAAEAITKLFLKFNKDDRKVSTVTGLSLRRVHDYIHIEYRASSKMKQMLRKESVSVQDVKRALRAAKDNIKKAEEILEIMVEEGLTDYQKRRMVEYGESNENASVKDILKEANRPRVEKRIILDLSDEIREALQHAIEEMEMAPEEITVKAIKEWLTDKGFIDD